LAFTSFITGKEKRRTNNVHLFLPRILSISKDNKREKALALSQKEQETQKNAFSQRMVSANNYSLNKNTKAQKSPLSISKGRKWEKKHAMKIFCVSRPSGEGKFFSLTHSRDL